MMPAPVYEIGPNTDENVRIVKQYLEKTGRSCGECYTCCVALGIEELKKWPGQSCKHLDGSKGACTRCSIYHHRPKACSNYYCAWLVGLGSDELRPDRAGLLVTLYPPFNYNLAQLGYDPGPMNSRYSATIHVTDPAKAGELGDENSKIRQVINFLTQDECNDIRIVTMGSDKIIHLHNGFVRQGRIVKSDRKDGYEELNFVTINPPVGQYLVIDATQSVQSVQSEAQS